MNHATIIRERIKMPQILEHYGIQIKRGNRIQCPLHNGEDYNCGVKSDYIHCFVCGKSADQISLVMHILGLPFQGAIEKINDDFSIGLPIHKKLSKREYLEAKRQAHEERRKQSEKQKRTQEVEKSYLTAFDNWVLLDIAMRKKAPKNPLETLDDDFVRALQEKDGAEYELTCAEIERYNHEHGIDD